MTHDRPVRRLAASLLAFSKVISWDQTTKLAAKRKKLAVATLLALSTSLQAGGTQFFSHRTAGDFSLGTLDHVILRGDGVLEPGPAVKIIRLDDGQTAAGLFSVDWPGVGTVVGTSPDGKLFKLDGDKLTPLAEFGEGGALYAAAVDAKGRLLVGVSNESAKLVRRTADGTTVTLFEDDSVQSIWAVRVLADASILLATGPNGKLIKLDAEGQNPVILMERPGANLLCLAADEKAIYVGTDPDGLVLSVPLAGGKPTVLFDAPAGEIGSVVPTPQGLAVLTSQPMGDEEGDAPSPSRRGPPSPQSPPREPSTRMAQDPPAAPEPEDDKPSTLVPPPATAAIAGETPPAPPAEPVDHNSLYLIDETGNAREIWQTGESTLGAVWANDAIYVGVGDGKLVRIDPATGRADDVARTELGTITSIRTASDGLILTAAEGVATVIFSGSDDDTKSYLSPVLDCGAVAKLGTIKLDGEGMTEVAVRSGNVATPDDTWTLWKCGKPGDAFVTAKIPSGRFVQYRVNFDDAAARVRGVTLAYRVPNRAPIFGELAQSSGTAGDGGGGENPAVRSLAWDATDPDSDGIRYDLLYRNVGGEWVTITTKRVETSFEWDTRGLPDERYELKVVARDDGANPAGEGKSAEKSIGPFTIDNTPPAVDVAVTTVDGGAKLSIAAKDNLSAVASAAWREAGSDDWQNLSPTDMLGDSPDERFEATLPLTGTGPRAVVIKVTDSAGNVAYQTATVPGPSTQPASRGQ